MAGKLPVGPICSPTISSIEAVLEPEKSDYYYFVSDKANKIYYTKTYQEHNSMIQYLKNQGLTQFIQEKINTTMFNKELKKSVSLTEGLNTMYTKTLTKAFSVKTTD